MYTVYILLSVAHNEIHIGNTLDLTKDLLYYNSGATGNNIVQYRPWELFCFEEYASQEEAADREQQLNSVEGKEYVWNLIQNRPQLMSVIEPEEEAYNV